MTPLVAVAVSDAIEDVDDGTVDELDKIGVEQDD
jgi:hypothetical protein